MKACCEPEKILPDRLNFSRGCLKSAETSDKQGVGWKKEQDRMKSSLGCHALLIQDVPPASIDIL